MWEEYVLCLPVHNTYIDYFQNVSKVRLNAVHVSSLSYISCHVLPRMCAACSIYGWQAQQQLRPYNLHDQSAQEVRHTMPTALPSRVKMDDLKRALLRSLALSRWYDILLKFQARIVVLHSIQQDHFASSPIAHHSHMSLPLSIWIKDPPSYLRRT